MSSFNISIYFFCAENCFKKMEINGKRCFYLHFAKLCYVYFKKASAFNNNKQQQCSTAPRAKEFVICLLLYALSTSSSIVLQESCRHTSVDSNYSNYMLCSYEIKIYGNSIQSMFKNNFCCFVKVTLTKHNCKIC